MKKYIILFILLVSSTCSAGITFDGVSIEGMTTYVPRFMMIADSLGVGAGDLTICTGSQFGSNCGGVRRGLQDLMGKTTYEFVGEYSDPDNICPDDPKLPPRECTWYTDKNYLIKAAPYFYQDKHFSAGGATIQMMATATAQYDQLNKWMNISGSDNVILLFLGANNTVNQFEKPDPCTEDPENVWTCTAPRVTDPVNIDSDIADYMAFIDYIYSYDDTFNIIVITIPPSTYPPGRGTDYEWQKSYQQAWQVEYNAKLILAVEDKQLTRLTLHYVDPYPELDDGDKWWDGTYGDGALADNTHPNAGGYNYIADLVYAKMIEIGLL